MNALEHAGLPAVAGRVDTMGRISGRCPIGPRRERVIRYRLLLKIPSA